MTARNLQYLLRPRSAVLIGASADTAKVGYALAHNLAGQFHGQTYFINPKYTRILDQPCWPDVKSLPAVPDLAVICTPANTVPQLVQQLGQRGVRVSPRLGAPDTGAQT